MTLSANDVFQALLSHNYFPCQKEKRTELPPIFSSVRFTSSVADDLIACVSYTYPKGDKNLTFKYRKGGYDQVDCRLTRYNNVFRLASIPHPKAYAHLCKTIQIHWDKISHTCTNLNSRIRPRRFKDGRIIIMDYEGFKSQKNKEVSAGFGKRYRAEADINDFFHSIYSHSIPWVAAGIDIAKKDTSNNHWYNEFDTMIRHNKRNETNGVPVGPGTSNIIAEFLLYVVDTNLKKKNYSFHRFIDDYTCYCDSKEQAERFIMDLSEELLKLKLKLNGRKTKIVQLPDVDSPLWISDLRTRIPKGKKIKLYEALAYIDYAVSIHKACENPSLLKFAVNTAVSKIENTAESLRHLKKRILELAFYYPLLLPSLIHIEEKIYNKLDLSAKGNELSYTEKELNTIIIENSLHRRTDALAWSLYFLQKQNLSPEENSIEAILKTNDCLAITALLNYSQCKNSIVVKHIEGLVVSSSDDYMRDQFWLLFYEAYYRGLISNPYPNDTTFEVLKKHNVTFLSPA